MEPERLDAVSPEVAVCIATVDPLAEPCRSCLAAIRAHTPEPHEVLLAVNYRPVQGYTRPANAAIRAADAPYIVIMNDDAIVQPGWWPPLRDALDAGAAVAFPREAEGQDWSDGLFNMWCFALREETVEYLRWEEGQFFDRSYIVHNADTALMDRITRRWQPPTPRVVCDESRVRHLMGRTVFGNAEIRLQVARWISADTALKDRRYASLGGTDDGRIP